MIDWITFDIGKAWQEKDKIETSKKIIEDFLHLQTIYWQSKPAKDRYYFIITGWFHDGNSDILSLKEQILKKNISWYTFHMLFRLLQWSYAFMEIRGMLK